VSFPHRRRAFLFGGVLAIIFHVFGFAMLSSGVGTRGYFLVLGVVVIALAALRQGWALLGLLAGLALVWIPLLVLLHFTKFGPMIH